MVQNKGSIKKLHESKIHKDIVNYVMFTDDNRHLISLGRDSSIRGINVNDYKTVISENLAKDSLCCCVQLPVTEELLIGTESCVL